LELGSATGILSIFLKLLGIDVTSSDYDDVAIETNIKYNAAANLVDDLPHVRHTWGTGFPDSAGAFDIVIASDILLYVKEYSNLVKTLEELLSRKASCWFLMGWKRRISDEALFFQLLEDRGFSSEMVGSRIYKIQFLQNSGSS